MARPKNKGELIDLSTKNFDKLLSEVEKLSNDEKDMEFLFEDRDRFIKDVIYHLYEWHNMFLNWYDVGMSGKKPDMPREGYTWKDIKEMNIMIWNRYKDSNLDDGLNKLIKTHDNIMNIIQSHNDAELFTKKYYNWTGTTSLGSYIISATSSHYEWAYKKIRKQIKLIKAGN